MDNRLTLPANTLLDGTYRIERVVGAGGFGITYEAEDVKLRTRVALKEYYPLEFGDRDSTMSVKPKSERHKQTFDWGRSNFLQEARTLARFDHPSIVRVTRVFETNATAYMVMRFEQGQSFEDWLRGLGRPPTQGELDRIVAPMLDALQVMHAENFLHRDIAPDNIIVRADGTPVLLDFGAARRAVAAMSRTLTGIVKAGYSPHEQYSVDSRLQGPWSDIYALGGTLYRAVTGRTPEEAALRVDEDHMPPAAQSARNGNYRPEFLAAIDACLKVRHAERPRSVAQLRPMLLDAAPPAKREPEPAKARQSVSGPTSTRKVSTLRPPPAARPRRWPAVAAALLALLGGAYGGIEYMRWQPAGSGASIAEAKRQAADTEASRQAAADTARRQEEAAAATQRQAALDAEKRRQEEAAAASQRQADLDAERRRQETAEAAAASQRQADLEAEQRRKDEAARVAAAEERARLAAVTLSADERATFVRQVQQVLKQGRCYDGAVNGRIGDTQDALDQFVDRAGRKGKVKPARIDLAKATGADFEGWLRDAGTFTGDVCAPPKPKPEVAKPQKQQVAKPERQEPERRRVERPAAEPAEPAQKLCWGYRNEVGPCKK